LVYNISSKATQVRNNDTGDIFLVLLAIRQHLLEGRSFVSISSGLSVNKRFEIWQVVPSTEVPEFTLLNRQAIVLTGLFLRADSFPRRAVSFRSRP
jgi:hypothetical protein